MPCLLKWPGKFQADGRIDAVAAHIDIVPTLLAACPCSAPQDLKLDGVNLLPILLGEQTACRIDCCSSNGIGETVPSLFAALARSGTRFKLVQPEGRGDKEQFEQTWALYDMSVDPGEQHNVIDGHPQQAAEMKAAYEAWFADVMPTRLSGASHRRGHQARESRDPDAARLARSTGRLAHRRARVLGS